MESKKILNRLYKWDQKVLLRYNGIGGKPVTYILKILSFFGRETIWLTLMAYYLFIWYDPYVFAHISITFLIGLILIAPIKRLFGRSRPFENLENINILERKPTSRSFPSWHAYNITSQGLLVGYLLNSLLIMIIFLIFALIVSFSRIQLGVHYPSDVIFGFLIGLIGFSLSIFLLSPFFYDLIMFLESFIPFQIQYYRFNSWLFGNIWYIILCIGIFSIIVLIALHKILRQFLRR
ncbi:MAG: phosphatase PAP2 family protein [Promethearchaeota archaeon]